MVSPIHPALQITMAAVSLAAAVTDVRWRVVPNWLVVTGFVSGFGLNTILYGWRGVGEALLGFGLALLVYVPLFILKAMGGGDVKLMAGIGCMAGPRNWLEIFIYASLAGGLYAICLVLLRHSGPGVFRNVLHILRELTRLRLPFHTKPELDIRHVKALSVPHAVAVAAGTLLFLFLERA